MNAKLSYNIEKILSFRFNIKYKLLLFLMKKSGINIKFYGNCYLKNLNRLSLGSNITFNDGCYVNAYGGIDIGSNVSISALSSIVSTKLDNNNLKQHINAKIIIGDNVQIGVSSSILPGVKIGNNVIVGAGSVVTKNIPDNCIVTGVPARILKKIINE